MQKCNVTNLLQLKIDRYKDLNAKIKQITNEIEKNRALQSMASEEELAELIKAEADLLEQRKKAYENLNSELKKEASEIKDYLSKNWFEFDAEGNISNYQSALERLEAWANEASGEEKERRKDLVEDLSSQVDRYYKLINDDISDGDKTIIDTSKEIYDIIVDQELKKIQAIKDGSDKIFDELEKRMNELEYQKNIDGETNADKNNNYFINKLAIMRDEIAQAEKDLANYQTELENAVTNEARKEAEKNIAETEKLLLSQKDSLQSAREEYQKWIVEMTQSPYQDKVWQLGTQELNKIKFELEVVGEIDATKKLELFNKQIEIQKKLADEAQKNFDNLVYIRDNVELTSDAYQQLISDLKKAEEELHNANVNMQQGLEEYQKYLLEIMYTPYRDKMWQLGTQQMNKIEYELEIVDDNDSVKKLELMEEKLKLQQQMADETKKYWEQLVDTRDNVDLTADAYQELIGSMMETEVTNCYK